MDRQRDRVGTSIIEAVPMPDWVKLARAARDGGDVREAIEAAQDDIREAIAAGMLSGVCIAMLARKTEGIPIIIRAEFKVEALPRFDTPEAALEYWRRRLNLGPRQVNEMREQITRYMELSKPLAGDVTAATTKQAENFIRLAAQRGLKGDDFIREFADSLGPSARARAETEIKTQLAKTYGERRRAQAREGALSGNQMTPFLQFIGIVDVKQSPTCRALHRFVAAADDHVWEGITPPLHHNCRSDVSPMAFPECLRKGLIRPSAGGGFEYTRGPRPYGNPPEWTLDDKGREVRVKAADDFGYMRSFERITLPEVEEPIEKERTRYKSSRDAAKAASRRKMEKATKRAQRKRR